ncbi:MAG: hypothetical protein N3I35_00810 [Clostridia bacterium]|nr:hypothetical protein [Clostridia bacterium]
MMKKYVKPTFTFVELLSEERLADNCYKDRNNGSKDITCNITNSRQGASF